MRWLMLIFNGTKMEESSKVLISGINGFTGIHLSKHLKSFGYKVYGIDCNILDNTKVKEIIHSVKPDYLIHLAANSFANDENINSLYDVNVIGSLNILDSLNSLQMNLKKVILSSSALVYGESSNSINSEDDALMPINHYGCSKLCMENISQYYFNKLPIIITRPYNYTGVGHDEKFIIPKIVKAHLTNQKSIELGNTEIYREFNDVRDVVVMYRLLMESNYSSIKVNLCSGKSHSIKEILSLMTKISQKEIKVEFNPLFARTNEIDKLSGSVIKLNEVIKYQPKYNINDTLEWMYLSGV